MGKSKALVVKEETQIVFPRGNGGFTTSLVVSDKFKVRHKNVIQKIENLVKKDKKDRLTFQPVEYQDKKGEFRKMYEMDRDNFTILAMRFTSDRALDWQIEFVKWFKFYENQYNQKRYDQNYIETREEGKVVRHDETDALAILKEYGQANGASKGFLNNVYAGYTKMLNKALFVIPKGVKYKNVREELTTEQLRVAAVSEAVIKNIVLEQINLNTDYHQIYYIVKNRIESIGNAIGRSDVPQFLLDYTRPQIELTNSLH